MQNCFMKIHSNQKTSTIKFFGKFSILFLFAHIFLLLRWYYLVTDFSVMLRAYAMNIIKFEKS